MNWMGGLGLLLFWLPGLGAFIAGTVGGWKAGSPKRALIAVFLPGVLLGVLAAVGATWMTRELFWGLLAGLSGVAFSLLNIVPMLAGALLGGISVRLAHTG